MCVEQKARRRHEDQPESSSQNKLQQQHLTSEFVGLLYLNTRDDFSGRPDGVYFFIFCGTQSTHFEALGRTDIPGGFLATHRLVMVPYLISLGSRSATDTLG